MKEKNTTIMISESTWKKLMAMKNVGETFDDVLMRLIKDE